jgi:hypothetical protein
MKRVVDLELRFLLCHIVIFVLDWKQVRWPNP